MSCWVSGAACTHLIAVLSMAVLAAVIAWNGSLHPGVLPSPIHRFPWSNFGPEWDGDSHSSLCSDPEMVMCPHTQ